MSQRVSGTAVAVGVVWFDEVPVFVPLFVGGVCRGFDAAVEPIGVALLGGAVSRIGGSAPVAVVGSAAMFAVVPGGGATSAAGGGSGGVGCESPGRCRNFTPIATTTTAARNPSPMAVVIRDDERAGGAGGGVKSAVWNDVDVGC